MKDIKDMEEGLDYFFERIMDNQPFAFPRWGDGEIKLLEKTHFHRNPEDIKNNRLWDFDPTDSEQLVAAKRIADSMFYEHEDLFWGIPCPSCSVCFISSEGHYQKYENQDNLTTVSLWVNGNHEETQRTLPILLRNKKVVFVGHETANVDNLPFPVEHHFKVGNNAWLHDYEIIQELKDYIRNSVNVGVVFLFACGPLSCYLITEIWKETQEHFLLDIGSAFDVDSYNRPTRGFHSGKGGYGKFCEWDNRE